MTSKPMCRLCGERNYSGEAKHLYGDEDCSEIINQIEKITGLRLDFFDNMPEHICLLCEFDLGEAIDFRDRCINTHERLSTESLQSMLKDVDTDRASVEGKNTDPSGSLEGNAKQTPAEEDVNYIVPNSDREANSDVEYPSATENSLLDSLNDGETKKSHDNHDALADSSVLTNFFFNDKKSDLLINYDKTSKAPDAQLKENTIKKKPRQIHKRSKQKANNKCNTGCILKKKRKKNGSQQRYMFDLLCEQCGQQFTDITNLKLHLLRHSGIQPFPCNLCERKFYTNCFLQRHIRTFHENMNPYPCRYENCGKKFKNSTIRGIHERRHIRDYRYVCDICDKRFCTGCKLREHLRVHTGELPFSNTFFEIHT
ncbi:myoneurin-like isoform X2 [Scaptodrosophila lebanonensis]|uniref:Myoneurin-like isoform X2 n=1 Tax=Drosophila lebanonensis TaxID=7225 RepID=A0A6J2TD07_DROLE|nr:myoneurin-like isoform X2 [Scaptodrosophila lebanonensis]